MAKINKHIEIVSSTDTTLSSMSQGSRSAILAVLSRHYARVGITMVDNLADLEALVAQKPDLVFLGMKFIPVNPSLGIQDPDKIWISEYLDEQGMACTGSDQDAHNLELNKPLAKQRVMNAGLKSSNFYVAEQGQPLSSDDISLNFPVFIKPSNRGGGMGIDSNSIAHDFDSLLSKVQSITTELQSDSLIEEYLPGREFSVAILRNEHDSDFSVMPIELVAEPDEHGERLLSGNLKSSNNEVVLEVTDSLNRSKVVSLALDAFDALGARDYGRIDIRLDDTGQPHFLEANLIPSLISGYGSFPKACLLNQGLDYESMILRIVKLAMTRNVDVHEEIPEPQLVFEIQPAY